MEFKIDHLTGDLDFGEGNELGLQLVKDDQGMAELRLAQAIGLNLTEWFLDITKGLPWIRNKEEDLQTNIRYFLGDKSPNAGLFVSNSLDKYILELPFVDKLKSSFTFNKITRTFTYTYSVTVSGDEVSFPSITLTI